jgi:outer membrane protein OmpA-like peptidoglycan-associated protein
MRAAWKIFALVFLASCASNHQPEEIQLVIENIPSDTINIPAKAIVEEVVKEDIARFDAIDIQLEELKAELKNAQIIRVGDEIKITFNSQILFDVDSDVIDKSSEHIIDNLARVLRKYEGTLVEVSGHTDNTGSEEYNEKLSKRRAAAVARYSVKQGVSPLRFRIQGYGEVLPIASNMTDEGRSMNRRVEVSIKGNPFKNKVIANAEYAVKDSSCYCSYDEYKNYVCRRLCDSWVKLPESAVSFNLDKFGKTSSTGSAQDIFMQIRSQGKDVELNSEFSEGEIGDELVNGLSAKNSSNPTIEKSYSYDGSDHVARQNLGKVLEDNNAIIMVGRVKDMKSNEPLSSKVTIKNLDTGEEVATVDSDPLTGKYSVMLEKGKQYAVSVEGKGYLKSHENIRIPENQGYTVIKEEFSMLPLRKGQKMNLRNVFFEQSRAILLEASSEQLKEVVQLMQINPTLVIELHGHTDGIGDADLNMILSKDRVETIKKYLIQEGIAANRIAAKAFGGTQPIASNETEETRKLNRRVEFLILKF